MHNTEVIGSRIDDRRQAGPAVPRMVLGARLQRLREAQYITREEAAEAIRAPDTEISRMELGRGGFRPRDVADLLTIYGVTDETERGTLLALADEANRSGWWHAYNDVVPDWLQTYLGLEQAADVIRCYEVQFVPGLLQTRDYAHAVIALGHGRAPDEELQRRVDLRMRRQQILYRSDAPYLWAVIDEAALRRPVGGATTMRAQLRHLIAVCDLPRVTVQMMPFQAGGHAAAGGPITLLRLPEQELPDVVYLEQLLGAHYPDRPEDIEYYRHIINHLVTRAARPAETQDILRGFLREI